MYHYISKTKYSLPLLLSNEGVSYLVKPSEQCVVYALVNNREIPVAFFEEEELCLKFFFELVISIKLAGFKVVDVN